jgi:GNAT superfamily N-acetyltransferase
MHIDIARVVNSADARDWHSVGAVSDPFDHPGLLADPIEEVLAELPDGAPSERVEMYVARNKGTIVGATKLKLPLADNTKVAHLRITVLPMERRRGIGRQLFEAMQARATEFGRDTIDGLVGGPLDEDPPGTYFAVALGASEALAKIRYQLILGALDEESLHALAEDAGAYSHEYELVHWIDRAPEQYLDDWASLEARVTSDSPHGELVVEHARWDGARCHEWEDQTIARNKARLVTGARHLKTDQLVAISHLAISRSRPTLVDQWGTVVSPEHRGHRLGMRIKIANLRNLLQAFPTAETIITWNALDNSYMRAVNKAIGYREAERYATWQLQVS